MTVEDRLAEVLADYEQLAPDPEEVLASIRARASEQHEPSARRLATGFAAVAAILVIALSAVVWTQRDKTPRSTTGDQPTTLDTAQQRPAFHYTSPTHPGDLIPVAARQRAESFTLPLLAGNGTFALADHRNRVVVLTWSASWCGPCRTAQNSTTSGPGFSATADVVTIALKDDRDSALEFFRSSTAGPVAFDAQGTSLSRLGQLPAAIPLTVLIDRNQLVAAVYVGSISRTVVNSAINHLAR